ncbi:MULTISPECIES: hypothetical protein [unclassified Vibrio]|uniref:hypothetical protein n=1 Tax=unclassified Vibrio TaxID=2614977 RepID=UPI002F3F8327
MQSKTKVRIAGVFFLIALVGGWLFISYVALQDYLDLLNNEPVVSFSPVVLLMPIGGLGVAFFAIVLFPKSIWRGERFDETYPPKVKAMVNRISIYFILIGVAFAAGWTYHTFDLMDKYGYVYSDDLNKHAGTSIYRKWVRVLPSI